MINIESKKFSWFPPTRFSKNCWGLGEYPHRTSANPLLAGSMLIDAGANLVQLLKSLDRIGIRYKDIRYLCLTHLHYDHFACIPDLQTIIKKAGGRAKVVAPIGSREVARNSNPLLMGTVYYPGALSKSLHIDMELSPGMELTDVSGVTVKFLNLPGHTSPNGAYLVDDCDGFQVLASGDSFGGLIDKRIKGTGFGIGPYFDSCHHIASVEVPIFEGHGYPPELLTVKLIKDRIKRTVFTASDLRPGPFPQTYFPHY